jgi:hypothetical protein
MSLSPDGAVFYRKFWLPCLLFTPADLVSLDVM